MSVAIFPYMIFRKKAEEEYKRKVDQKHKKDISERRSSIDSKSDIDPTQMDISQSLASLENEQETKSSNVETEQTTKTTTEQQTQYKFRKK